MSCYDWNALVWFDFYFNLRVTGHYRRKHSKPIACLCLTMSGITWDQFPVVQNFKSSEKLSNHELVVVKLISAEVLVAVTRWKTLDAPAFSVIVKSHGPILSVRRFHVVLYLRVIVKAALHQLALAQISLTYRFYMIWVVSGKKILFWTSYIAFRLTFALEIDISWLFSSRYSSF